MFVCKVYNKLHIFGEFSYGIPNRSIFSCTKPTAARVSVSGMGSLAYPYLPSTCAIGAPLNHTHQGS